MKEKFLEVKEFDKICQDPKYKDGNDNFKYLPPKAFKDLEQFIHVFTEDEEHSDALQFMKIGYRRDVGDIISLNSYVGLIQIDDGYQIQVLPKIEFVNSEETKKIFLKMIRSMKDFPSKLFNNADLRTKDMNLYEVFISLYLQEVNKVVKHGLRSSYVTVENNENYFKGKLLINEQIKRNIAHREKFYVQYDEYSINRPENKLIKSTLLKLQKISDSMGILRRIRQLLNYFDEVDPSYNYEKDFSKVVIDRNTRDYDLIMRWSNVFLQNKSFTPFSGDSNARALLFPMEKVFESYVAQQMKKAYEPDGWNVKAQDRRYYLFDEPKHYFALKPDIVLKKGDCQIILDTKWKVLTDNPKKNYGISQSDMYQMYAYSKKYNTPDVFLLYPINKEMENHEEIYFKSKDNVNVRVFFVDLANINEGLQSLKKLI